MTVTCSMGNCSRYQENLVGKRVECYNGGWLRSGSYDQNGQGEGFPGQRVPRARRIPPHSRWNENEGHRLLL